MSRSGQRLLQGGFVEYCRGCVWGFLGERDEYSLAVFGGVCGEGFGQLVEWVLQGIHAERSWRHSPNWGPQCFAVSLTIRLNGSYPVDKVATLVNDFGKPLLLCACRIQKDSVCKQIYRQLQKREHRRARISRHIVDCLLSVACAMLIA